MKKRDIIQLVKETIAERRKRYGQHDYYGNNVGGRNSISGMPGVWEESQGTLSSDMLNYADQYHMELVDTMKGVSTYPDKRTGGFRILFPHKNGPGPGALFGKEVVMKIEASKAAAKAAAQKTVSKFQDQIEDYEITDSSPGGVYGSIHLWIMPKTMDESPMFRTGIKQDMAPKEMAGRIKSVFDKVNGAQHPVQTPEWHKNRFKNKYGISFPENIKNINKDQALAMNKYANDMTIKEDITDDISKAEDEVQKATQSKADAEVKVADLRKKKADGEKGALEEVGDFEGKVASPESMSNADIMALQTVVSNYSLNKVLNTLAVIADRTGKHDEADMVQKLANQIQDFDPSFEPGYRGNPTDMDETKDPDDEDEERGWMGADDAKDMMEKYIKERGNDNLMEHMDKYRKRAVLMEGATQKLFALFNQGKTDADVRAHYLQMNVDMPEAFVAKLRKNWEALRKTKLDLTLADKEAEGFNTIQAPGESGMEGEVGMEPPMEEKQLASGLK
jgi:hypothetical protein